MAGKLSDTGPGKGAAPDAVVAELRRAIVAGEFPAGAQLRQGALAERFGVSRIPVREALRALAAEGLVTMNANRGYIVVSLSLDQAMELMEIRIALESRAIRLAVPNMIEDDLDEAERILTGEDALAPSGRSDADWRFLQALYQPCGLSRLLSLIETNYGQVGSFIRPRVAMVGGRDWLERDHRALLELCREGDAPGAAARLEDHILRTQKLLRAAIRRRV